LDVGPELEERKLGDNFRMRGLIAAAEAQKMPVLTFTELQMVIS
jgi:hypothetical protein